LVLALNALARPLRMIKPVSQKIDMSAIIAPGIIKNPGEAIVFQKPSFIIVITSFPGITAMARKSDTRKRETNA
jgi:hypothetical protein